MTQSVIGENRSASSKRHSISEKVLEECEETGSYHHEKEEEHDVRTESIFLLLLLLL